MFYLKIAKRRRNNIVMVGKEKPKKVVSPNGRTFFAKCKRVRVSIQNSKKVANSDKGKLISVKAVNK